MQPIVFYCKDVEPVLGGLHRFTAMTRCSAANPADSVGRRYRGGVDAASIVTATATTAENTKGREAA